MDAPPNASAMLSFASAAGESDAAASSSSKRDGPVLSMIGSGDPDAVLSMIGSG